MPGLHSANSLLLAQVLHVRNLPYEVTHEELVELCEPFGSVVQSKLHVGPNRNQAFVEFTSLETAQGMVNYFANSPDPAKASFVHMKLRSALVLAAMCQCCACMYASTLPWCSRACSQGTGQLRRRSSCTHAGAHENSSNAPARPQLQGM